jgi:hypothetical protein
VCLRVWDDHFSPPCCVTLCCMVVFFVCVCVGGGGGEGLGVCFYLVSISFNISNIGLCVSVYISFICNFFLLILCMWYRFNVFMCFPSQWTS